MKFRLTRRPRHPKMNPVKLNSECREWEDRAVMPRHREAAGQTAGRVEWADRGCSQGEVDMDRKNKYIIQLNHIIKRFYIGQPNELEILHGIDLTVEPGEFVSVVGESGSGKSTLMNIIGALDRPTGGQYFLDGTDICRAKDATLSGIRNREIGFVFQTYNLIARSTALSNVELPMLYAGVPREKRIRRAKELLALVGMEDRMTHRPEELSGGQKQRVAIARAMANDPSVLLADEPTGALDSRTGRTIMDIFHRLNKEQGKTIVLITHSADLAQETGRIVTLSDGVITGVRKGGAAC